MAKFHLKYLIAALVFITCFQLSAQKGPRLLERNSKKVWVSCRDSCLKYIEFKENSSGLYNDKIKLEDELNASSGTTFSRIDKSTDKLGIEHIRHQQYHQGIPVEGAFYSIHKKGNNVIKANGEYHRIKRISNHSKLSETEAYSKAIEFIKAEHNECEIISNNDKGEIVILPIDSNYVLTYKFDIYTVNPLSRNYVYIDALSGKVVKTESRLRPNDIIGTAVTKYHGNQNIRTGLNNSKYRLHEYSRGNGIQTLNLAGAINFMVAKDFTDDDNYWNSSVNQDDAATSIHYSIEKTYDFFNERFGRNSFDGQGSVIMSYVHYDVASNSAFWDGDQLFFGDGDNMSFKAFASTEIVAHEFTHAVTQYTANLAYSGESGALNESFSDIFGIAVDFYANPNSANFIIGEQVSVSGSGIRNLANPKQKNQPGTYKGEYWNFENKGDEGIHTNCGVQNYWFYLLCNGGTGVNDIGGSYAVLGIGIDKAIAIAYRNLTVYLTSNSGYEDARFYSIQSAIDLYGECSDEVVSVTNAWYAVGVGEAFKPDIDAEFEVSQTSSCSLPLVVNFINRSRNASGYTWYFGDGGTSTSDNPSHAYTEYGNYTIKLIATGNQLCNKPDTIIKSDLISINSNNGMLNATCKPYTINPSQVGILNFILGDINNSSALAIDEGEYVDFSCSAHTNLTAGQKVPITIVTSPDNNESVRVWIDVNNDGVFSESEKVFTSDAKTEMHSGYIIVPSTITYNKKLRLRVISDLSAIPIQSACFEIQAGQAEDYAVTIQPPNGSPIADFSPVHRINLVSDSVSFVNLSLNVPEIFEWSFPGGTPSVSTLKNPKVLYKTPGNYTVSLLVRNASGENTKVVEEVVKLVNPTIIGSNIGSSATEGLLYDYGGSKGKYSNNENSEFVINVACVPEIYLNFQMLDLEADCDNIYIYEGTDISGKLIFPLPGMTKYDTIMVKSGKAFVKFVSDGSTTKQGFVLEWTSKETNYEAVIADFMLDQKTYFTNEIINFQNISSDNTNEWCWNFGDSTAALSHEPTHWYNRPGIKNITLIASNCISSDTIVKQIIIKSDNNSGFAIPDQVISHREVKVIDLFNMNFNILKQNINISYHNSNNSIVQVGIKDNQLILNPLSIGETELIINVIYDNKILIDTFNISVIEKIAGVLSTTSAINLILYPNPVNEKLFIELNDESYITGISIYNDIGQLIISDMPEITGQHNIEIDVESLKTGLYIIELYENSKIYTSKFIKQ